MLDWLKNWNVTVYHWDGSYIPPPIQTPLEKANDPKQGPMWEELIKGVMSKFEETLRKLKDDINEV